jgi:hypothetical protein
MFWFGDERRWLTTSRSMGDSLRPESPALMSEYSTGARSISDAPAFGFPAVDPVRLG